MGLSNTSNLRRTSSLKTLVEFVSRYYDFANLTHVSVFDSKQSDTKGKPTCGGQAGTFRAPWREYRFFVEIALNPECTYPRVQQLTRLTPCVTFESWEDEFVMVLAHELRHADQFALGAFRSHEGLEAEVDAETYAASVLEAYRTSQRQQKVA